MSSLPFLVRHGGWVWPLVGILFMATAAAAMWWWERRSIRLKRARHEAPRRHVPVIVAIAAGLGYFLTVRCAGSSIVEIDEDDRPAIGFEWLEDPPSLTGLAFAAATPARDAALERLYESLAAATFHGNVLSMRMDVLREVGGQCELIVEQLTLFSHHEDAIAAAKQCAESAELSEVVSQAHLGLGQLDLAGRAIERAMELARGQRRWTHDDAVILAMGRRWTALAHAASYFASGAASESVAKPTVELTGPLANLPPPAKAAAGVVAQTWECIGIYARYRAGDTKALEALRARKGACMLLVADATGSPADLQALSAFSLPAGGQPRVEQLAPRNILVASLSQLADEAATGKEPADRATRPYSRARVERTDEQFKEYARKWHGPDGWAGNSTSGTDLGDLRQLVLMAHVPGDPSHYEHYRRGQSAYELLGGIMEPPDQIGMGVRAIQALLPHRHDSAEAAEALLEGLPAVAMFLANAGQHDLAIAYLEIAAEIALGRPVPEKSFEDARIDPLEEVGTAAVSVLLRAGQTEPAGKLFDKLATLKLLEGEKLYLGDTKLGVTSFVGLARGDFDAMARLVQYGEPIEALQLALTGDASKLRRLDFQDMAKLQRTGLPLIVPRIPESARGPVRDLLVNYLRQEPGGTLWVMMHGHRLHLAERLGHAELIAQQKQRVGALFEAITARDTSLVIAMIGDLEY